MDDPNLQNVVLYGQPYQGTRFTMRSEAHGREPTQPVPNGIAPTVRPSVVNLISLFSRKPNKHIMYGTESGHRWIADSQIRSNDQFSQPTSWKSPDVVDHHFDGQVMQYTARYPGLQTSSSSSAPWVSSNRRIFYQVRIKKSHLHQYKPPTAVDTPDAITVQNGEFSRYYKWSEIGHPMSSSTSNQPMSAIPSTFNDLRKTSCGQPMQITSFGNISAGPAHGKKSLDIPEGRGGGLHLQHNHVYLPGEHSDNAITRWRSTNIGKNHPSQSVSSSIGFYQVQAQTVQ
jgi:hypothetical protein